MAALATRQHGLVTRVQARALGLSGSAIARRLAAGRLIAVHPGVYAVGHAALSVRGVWLAAVLACGPRAALSHGSAALLWEIGRGVPRRIHVTVPGTAGRDAPRGVRLHRYRSLDPDADVTVRDGIPVTTVERTLLDLATARPPRVVRRAFAQADVMRILDVGEVGRLVAAHPRRRGSRVVAAIAAEHRPEGRGLSRSDFEDRLVELCERHGLPRPKVNAEIAGLEVDVSWPDAGVVAEADGYEFHRTRAAFERDRERDAILTAAGCVVHRFTERQVTRAPATVIAALRRSLSDRGRIAT
ncbi:MAG: type IV toxin-antitoxin system AbiEi family antitoxin domain-containing protein [Solirubrobacteraceae bacterium]|nr:type IV toxin-antitoxin system AbiEi family antitoxin domain-containing protein [Solirubrobacteraceae bacterium]